jgi:hypothetical protein
MQATDAAVLLEKALLSWRTDRGVLQLHVPTEPAALTPVRQQKAPRSSKAKSSREPAAAVYAESTPARPDSPQKQRVSSSPSLSMTEDVEESMVSTALTAMLDMRRTTLRSVVPARKFKVPPETAVNNLRNFDTVAPWAFDSAPESPAKATKLGKRRRRAREKNNDMSDDGLSDEEMVEDDCVDVIQIVQGAALCCDPVPRSVSLSSLTKLHTHTHLLTH